MSDATVCTLASDIVKAYSRHRFYHASHVCIGSE